MWKLIQNQISHLMKINPFYQVFEEILTGRHANSNSIAFYQILLLYDTQKF